MSEIYNNQIFVIKSTLGLAWTLTKNGHLSECKNSSDLPSGVKKEEWATVDNKDKVDNGGIAESW